MFLVLRGTSVQAIQMSAQPKQEPRTMLSKKKLSFARH